MSVWKQKLLLCLFHKDSEQLGNLQETAHDPQSHQSLRSYQERVSFAESIFFRKHIAHEVFFIELIRPLYDSRKEFCQRTNVPSRMLYYYSNAIWKV